MATVLQWSESVRAEACGFGLKINSHLVSDQLTRHNTPPGTHSTINFMPAVCRLKPYQNTWLNYSQTRHQHGNITTELASHISKLYSINDYTKTANLAKINRLQITGKENTARKRIFQNSGEKRKKE